MKNAEGFLQASSGRRLFYRRWDAADPRAACVVAHGLGEHSGRYEALAHALGVRGFAVWAMDHRGHGRSEGRRGDCRSITDFTEDLQLFVQEVASLLPGIPRILIGHSLGGLIALEYAVRYPETLRGVVLSSPALKLALEPSRLKTAFAVGLSRLAPQTWIPNGIDPTVLCHNPQVVHAYQTDPLNHRVLTARCAVVLRQAMRQAPSLAQDLKIPCLIVQAGSDRICDPDAAAQFASAAHGAPVRFHRYEGLYHEVFNEPEQARVIEDLSAWIDEVIR